MPHIFWSQNISQSICYLTDEEINIKFYLQNIQSNTELDNEILLYITKEAGITPNFNLKDCSNINNAIAIINPYKNNQRTILFDKKYFNNLYKDNNWYAIFILAHEIGHHLNGHTIPKELYNYSEIQNRELEADYFAGYILYRLGASENDIIKIINTLPEPNTQNSTHPKNQKRIHFALQGYTNEFNSIQKRLEKFSTNLENDIKLKNINKDIKFIQEYIRKYGFDNNIENLYKAEHLLQNLAFNNNDIEDMRNYLNYSLGKYSKVLEYYKTKYYTDRNLINLIIYLNILDGLNLSDERLINELKKEILKIEEPKMLLEYSLFLAKRNENELFNKYIKNAYDKIKTKEDDILKADICFFYARSIYELEIKKENPDFNFSKSLFLKSKNIIDKYPRDDYYLKYYSSILFHLASISKKTMNCEYVYNYSSLLQDNELNLKSNKRPDLSILLSPLILECNEPKSHFKSLDFFTKNIMLAPTKEIVSQMYFQRAFIYFDLKELDLAEKDLKKACELGNEKSCEILKELK